jgi:hypothetical protein
MTSYIEKNFHGSTQSLQANAGSVTKPLKRADGYIYQLLNIKKSAFYLQCIYVFRMIFAGNSDCAPIQH